MSSDNERRNTFWSSTPEGRFGTGNALQNLIAGMNAPPAGILWKMDRSLQSVRREGTEGQAEPPIVGEREGDDAATLTEDGEVVQGADGATAPTNDQGT